MHHVQAAILDDTAALDVMDLRARARRAKKQHGIELIVIDYLQLCTCREAARMGSRQIEVSMISQQIKAMAKERSQALGCCCRGANGGGGRREPGARR